MQVPIPNCPNVLSAAYLEEVAAGENVTVCSEQEINLNGSALALYNDTSYYDDLTFAATWLYRATGDSAYLTEAEAWYVKHLYTTNSNGDSVSPPALSALLCSACCVLLFVVSRDLPRCYCHHHHHHQKASLKGMHCHYIQDSVPTCLLLPTCAPWIVGYSWL